AGPRITAVAPQLISFGRPVTLSLTGAADTVSVTLSRSDGDPDDPADGRPDPATTHSTGPGRLVTSPVPNGLPADPPPPHPAPGRALLTVTNLSGGWRAGSDGAVLTVAPAVVSVAAPLQPGAAATLQVSHVLAEGRVAFLGMTAGYTRTSPTSVTVTVPAGVA